MLSWALLTHKLRLRERAREREKWARFRVTRRLVTHHAMHAMVLWTSVAQKVGKMLRLRRVWAHLGLHLRSFSGAR